MPKYRCFYLLGFLVPLVFYLFIYSVARFCVSVFKTGIFRCNATMDRVPFIPSSRWTITTVIFTFNLMLKIHFKCLKDKQIFYKEITKVNMHRMKTSLLNTCKMKQYQFHSIRKVIKGILFIQ